MFREFQRVRQEGGPGRRRWFESEGLELVVWFDAADRKVGFQLCYDLGGGEHALTWREGAGFTHSRVDSGDESPLANRTPILVPAAATPWKALLGLYDRRSGTLEPALRDWVREKLAGAVPT